MNLKKHRNDYDFLKDVILAQRESESEDQQAGYDYLSQSFQRILYTFQWIPKGEGHAIVEIGAAPFFITSLCFRNMKGLRYCGINAHPDPWAPFCEPPRHAPKTLRVRGETYRLDTWLLNVEKDRLPLEDDSVNTALCTEVIEHLLFDPSFMLQEIKRVLKPGGSLILSTMPNAVHWSKVVMLLFNHNVADPYREGGYYRHNRLYTPAEIKTVLRENGFVLRRLAVTTFDEIRFRPLMQHLAKKTMFLIDGIMSMLFSKIPFIYHKCGNNILAIAEKPASAIS